MRKPGQVSLDRALSKLGLASRTQARELITSGRVRVNGRIETHPGFPVVPEKARIEIDGKPTLPRSRVVLLLHKTRGTLTTRADEKGRKTVFDLLPVGDPTFEGLHAVGRLDLATTGLLLLTNDTRLSSWLTDPAQQIERVYHVTVRHAPGRGRIEATDLERLERGIESPVGRLEARRAELLKSSSRESALQITLTEGRNREIRRLIEAIGSEVTALKRLSYGPLELGGLAPGAFREITEAELFEAFPALPRSTTLSN